MFETFSAKSSSYEIMDATKSLDLVGYTYARMMDILPATPLVIVSGHFESSIRKSPEDDNLRYWPYKILGPERVSAICADYPTYTDSQTRNNLAKVAGKWGLSGGDPAEIGPARRFFAEGKGGQVPQWALADVKRWSSEIVWVDDKGWLIVRASKGKQDGFAWLYLRKQHN